MKTLLLTPPLTQLNTPYPATAYLKYFLQSRNFAVEQADLGIELILNVFCKKGLQELFNQVERVNSEDDERLLLLKERYISCVEPVIRFLQNKEHTLAHRLCSRTFLPEGPRFSSLDEMEPDLFGRMSVEDKARFIATLFIEDLGDFIQRNIDQGFGFSRYREKISMAASSFDELDAALESSPSYMDRLILDLLEKHLQHLKPDVVGFSVPFPGNLYSALLCGKYIKQRYPDIKLLMGGGYPNTELRDLSDTRVFKYIDYITLDDGELPVLRLLESFSGKTVTLQRTFTLQDNLVTYFPKTEKEDFPHTETGAPDYSGLPLDQYLNIIEVANPMHRLWNDGRWNKMTIAHGCYWKRCSFCDVTLDYIERYEEAPAKILVDRIEKLIEQTGQSGFHFVDEAAPPAVLKELAIEIIRRQLNISWWTNIRFERAFSYSLCRLLAASGCIAVSGGLEVASDRLLAKMKKGTNLDQVTQSTDAFSSAGIMVHSYLMYGFPTETQQETIDSLEVVRQLYEQDLVQSSFWHRFALTEHSPVGKNPSEYGVTITGPEFAGFAKNELTFNDPLGCDHSLFSNGLRKSLFNYMHGNGLDFPLDFWFDHPVPATTHKKNLIELKLKKAQKDRKYLPGDRVLWLGNPPVYFEHEDQPHMADLVLVQNREDRIVEMEAAIAEWFCNLLSQITISEDVVTYSEMEEYFQQYFQSDLAVFVKTSAWSEIIDAGLLILR